MQLSNARKPRLRKIMVAVILGTAWVGSSGPGGADAGSLFPRTSGAATPLFPPAKAAMVRSSNATESLLARKRHSFVAPLPAPVEDSVPARMRLPDTGPLPKSIEKLLSLIALAEAGPAGYDAVQHGATVRPNFPPTHMTLGEIYAWIEATPGQPHAIGRYQFIPKTLRRVARLRGYSTTTFFTPDIQDALALVLLEEAGLTAFRSGTLEKTKFMHNLARIWAGLPLPNGKSYYDGYAGNKATMSWPVFWNGMARAFAPRT